MKSIEGYSSYSDLNKLYREYQSLWQRDISPEGFQWLIGDDASGNTLAFLRWSDEGLPLVSVTNFSPVPQESYSLPLPVSGTLMQLSTVALGLLMRELSVIQNQIEVLIFLQQYEFRPLERSGLL
ncbi:MAG: hypothetical protein RIT18_1191 [Actinomycetota bacterium]